MTVDLISIIRSYVGRSNSLRNQINPGSAALSSHCQCDAMFPRTVFPKIDTVLVRLLALTTGERTFIGVCPKVNSQVYQLPETATTLTASVRLHISVHELVCFQCRSRGAATTTVAANWQPTTARPLLPMKPAGLLPGWVPHVDQSGMVPKHLLAEKPFLTLPALERGTGVLDAKRGRMVHPHVPSKCDGIFTAQAAHLAH